MTIDSIKFFFKFNEKAKNKSTIFTNKSNITSEIRQNKFFKNQNNFIEDITFKNHFQNQNKIFTNRDSNEDIKSKKIRNQDKLFTNQSDDEIILEKIKNKTEITKSKKNIVLK